MVLLLLGAIPNAIRDFQRFMSQSPGDVRSPMMHLEALVAKWLGERDAVVIVDGSGFPKQGKHSIGVAYQYCGHLGKVANCQEGVFLAVVSRCGYSFLDERLYLPQEWFAPDRRRLCKAGGLPERLHFQTEGELALGMLQELNERGVVPFQWVAYDESYGKYPAFSQEIAAMHKWYMAEVPSDTQVWLRTPLVEEPGRGLTGRPRLHRRLRRSLGLQPELKFYLSNAPARCPTQELIRVSGLRWPIETALEEAKGEVGMDQYETRTWLGWQDHMFQTFMAHLFLMRLRLVFKKTSCAHYRPGSATGGANSRRRKSAFL